MHGMGVLRNLELPDTIGHAVLDARLFVLVTVRKVCVKEILSATVDDELSRSHFQPCLGRLCPLRFDHSGAVLGPVKRIAVVTGKTAPVPEKQNQDNDECKHADSGAHGNSGRGVRVAASVGTVPNFSEAYENKNERPVGRKNRPGIECRTPVVEEKKSTDGDENDREDEGDSPWLTVAGHGIPPLPCTTHAEGK